MSGEYVQAKKKAYFLFQGDSDGSDSLIIS